MNIRQWAIGLLLISSVAFSACKKQEHEKNGSSLLLMLLQSSQGQPVGQAIASGLSITSSAASGATDSSSNAVAFFAPGPDASSPIDRAVAALERLPDAKWPGALSLVKSRLTGSLEASSNYSGACPSGGTIARDVTGNDFGQGGTTTVNAIWTFTNCAMYQFSASGTRENDWASLSTSAPYVQASSTLNIAPNYTVSGSFGGETLTVTEAGKMSGTAVQNTGDHYAHTLTFSSATATTAAYTLQTNITWTGALGGSTIFQHTVTTPTPLSISWDKSAGHRTVNSGVQTISHDLAGFAVALTYSSVVFDYKTCLPLSGSISVNVTGTRTGTGSVTFHSGIADYTFTGTNARGQSVSESGSLAVTGCKVN